MLNYKLKSENAVKVAVFSIVYIYILLMIQHDLEAKQLNFNLHYVIYQQSKPWPNNAEAFLQKLILKVSLIKSSEYGNICLSIHQLRMQ